MGFSNIINGHSWLHLSTVILCHLLVLRVRQLVQTVQIQTTLSMTLMRRQKAIPPRRLHNSSVHSSWCSPAQSLMKELLSILTLQTQLSAPQTLGSTPPPPQPIIIPYLSLQSIRETKANVTIEPDGSETGGTTAGDAAMVSPVGDPANPVNITHTSKVPGAELASSYEEGKAALLLALN